MACSIVFSVKRGENDTGMPVSMLSVSKLQDSLHYRRNAQLGVLLSFGSF